MFATPILGSQFCARMSNRRAAVLLLLFVLGCSLHGVKGNCPSSASSSMTTPSYNTTCAVTTNGAMCYTPCPFGYKGNVTLLCGGTTWSASGCTEVDACAYYPCPLARDTCINQPGSTNSSLGRLCVSSAMARLLVINVSCVDFPAWLLCGRRADSDDRPHVQPVSV